LKYTDPSGHWVETAVDVAGIIYDVYEIKKDGLNWINGLALTADIVCAALPVAVGGGLMVRTAAHADDVADAIRGTERLVSLSDEAFRVGKRISDDLLERVHHLATNKNYIADPRWSEIFEGLLRDNGYGDILSLNRKWNKLKIPHLNKSHPSQYHQWVESAMEEIHRISKGDSDLFLDLWNKNVVDVVDENPWVLSHDWWDNFGDEWLSWWDELVENGLK